MTTQMKAILALVGVSLLSLSACVSTPPSQSQPVVVQQPAPAPQQPTVVVTPHAY